MISYSQISKLTSIIIQIKANILLAALLILLTNSCRKEDDNSPAYSDMELEILQLVNQYRLINNLDALEMHQILFEEASAHTNYMIEENSMNHDNSGDRFTRISDELGSSAFAENVARGQQTANEVVTAWLNSDGHRKNIEGNYTLTGISAKRNEKGEYFYTQIFSNQP